ncbi:soluble inorganic pyrophosphatase 6, chloroplastic-like isoform X2 [Papaver somniferum]|uniref:soluble inorganic pyrophosphatase 6, chloroplastic-like isoform X2 n=1 Tax=Papaver somniferum TaxID=3469 RepID=UPI000E700DAC|nr:soluble inorganic pyrophosphatase 6, chloroplastic-like isoform X2 [Papaver somniferum]
MHNLLSLTCEDPTVANSEVDGAFGNNDPVDVVEIGDRQGKIGEILKVKPLGALAMINEGELDWKIVATSLDDPRASLVNDGTLTAIRDWFRDYKIPDGKPANKFGLGNKAANKDYALKVITETNEAWAKLVKRTVPAGDFYPLFQTFFLAEFETNFLQFFVSNILYSFFLSSFFSVLVFFNGF